MTYLDTLRVQAAKKQAELVRLEAELAADRTHQRALGQRIEAAEQQCAVNRERLP